MPATLKAGGIEVFGPVCQAFKQILTPDAREFIGGLARQCKGHINLSDAVRSTT